jgi:hypothetical protein
MNTAISQALDYIDNVPDDRSQAQHIDRDSLIADLQKMCTAEPTAWVRDMTVRDMIESAWLAGYYHSGYTHDSAYACQEATKCADECLGKGADK